MAISTIGTNSLASTAQIGSLTTASGSAPSYSTRAWVNFNGTGTVAIRASGNVSSITDNGTGDYTVNFTIPMPDANYSVNVSSSLTSSSIETGMFVSPTTTSSARVISYSTAGTYYDESIICVAISR